MRNSQMLLQPNDWIPNNSILPVLLYHGALDDGDRPNEFARRFSSNGWTGIWHSGVFDYHHYHSGAHEVLGIAEGGATLLIGGPAGHAIEVRAGDCLVLPAGTGHMNLGSSVDFRVVGAYPPGQHADILTSAPSPEQRDRIGRLPLPISDPIEGRSGFLTTIWRKATGERDVTL